MSADVLFLSKKKVAEVFRAVAAWRGLAKNRPAATEINAKLLNFLLYLIGIPKNESNRYRVVPGCAVA
ncbi:MAG: hypothetical protein ACR65O_15900 [Methylomicrobium sp.]